MQRTHKRERKNQGWHSEDWYDRPLWYDIVHWPDTASEVDGLERIERRFCLGRTASDRGRRRRVWLEPACGSGRYLRAAAARGRGVVGIDLNPKMVAFANEMMRKRGLEGDIRVGDMTRVPGAGEGGSPIPSHGADFSFCLINSIRHLPTDAAMLGHLRSMYGAVRPGGVYCVGLGLTHYGAEFASEAVFSGRRGGTRVHQLAQFIPPEKGSRFETIVNHLTISRGGEERHLDNSYRLRCYSGAQWAAILSKTGWKVVGVVDEAGEDAVMMSRGAWKRPTVSAYGVFVLRRGVR